MPQFDIFSFFSQLFWVFTSFFMLYLSLSYYLLPSIAITLKVRRRKLFFQSATAATTTELSASSYGDIITKNLEKVSRLPGHSHLNEISDTHSTQSLKISAHAWNNEILKKVSSELLQKVLLSPVKI